MKRLFLLALAACLHSQTPAGRLQEQATEFNLHTRFGRMEIAVENVAPEYRIAFARTHKGWGSSVRIADSETSGMRMDIVNDAEVTVRVGWYRVEEGELKNTVLKQKWHDEKGKWLMTNEERIDGDLGLLGEKVDIIRPDVPTTHAQFPTVRIGGN